MIEYLPLERDIETKAVLKKLAIAERALGTLRGVTSKVPNEDILVNTLFLQEAKASSEIENIVTTHDEIFKVQLEIEYNLAAKEVENYSHALREGFSIVKEQQLLTTNTICSIQERLENNNAGLRRQSGTTLKNTHGEVVYTPPQDYEEIARLMSNLEKFINDNDLSDLNPLVKMAVIHHQFESIHPFYDGNGRTGRIINILYLVLTGLLDTPVLYLSGYIIDTKKQYYDLLQKVRDERDWEEWILYILNGVILTSQETVLLIEKIISLMQDYKHSIRDTFPKMYSQDLINNLFEHPYTKIEFLEQALGVHRQTAAKYLNSLANAGFLSKVSFGKSNYYLNTKLIEILKSR